MRKTIQIIIILGGLLLNLSSCNIFHSHQYIEKIVDPTCTEEGKISLECSCGKIKKEEIIEKTNHSFDEGTITKEATCEEEGIKIFICTKCNYSKGQKLEKVDHQGVYIPAVSPTCLKTGTNAGYQCKWCDKKLSGLETLPVLEHDYLKGICKICGDTTYSDGLVYELDVQNRTYTIINVGTCNDENIIIPAYYNGLPVSSIGEKAFYGCSFIKTVTFENEIDDIKIGEEAFGFCFKLTDVINTEKIISIGKGAFSGCFNLRSFNLGKDFYHLQGRAFGSCSNLKLSIDEDNPYFELVNDAIYSEDMKILYLCLPSQNNTSFVIPKEVEIIYSYAFFNLEIEKIIFEEDSQVTKIGDYAFGYCSVKEINLGELKNLKTIDNNAFFNTNQLTEIIIPENVKSVGFYAFYGCDSLTIYCERTMEPIGWHSNWNGSNCIVVWGYKE